MWVEKQGDYGKTTWYGYITRVPDGERFYLRSLNQITFYLSSYLEQMGVSLSLWWRIRHWINQQIIHRES
jgi:hypothetical protein